MRSLTVFWCRTTETSRVLHVTGLAAGILAAVVASTLLAKDRIAVLSTPERLVEDAGQAKGDGNIALAYALLREAMAVVPSNPVIRWQLGQVKVGGEWLSVEEAERRAAADPREAK